MKNKMLKILSAMMISVLMVFVSGCGSDSDGGSSNPPALSFSVQIDQADTTVAKGTKGYLTATAIYKDGTTKDITKSANTTWESSNQAVAIIDENGNAKAVGLGTATITVTYFGVSDTGNITVTDATLNSISVAPAVKSVPNGIDVTYTATGIFSDGTNQDLTKEVSWTSSDTTVAKMDLNIARTITTGSTTTKAEFLGVNGTASLTVTAATLSSVQIDQADTTVAKGTKGYITATAIYSDGTSEDITTQSTWISSDVKVVAIDKTGAAEAVGIGSTVITVDFKGKNDTGNITVTDATLQSINIQSSKPELIEGETITMTALGIFSDETTQDITKDVSWISSNTDIIKMDSNLAQGITAGTSTIKATLNGVSNSLDIKVNRAQVTSLKIEKDDNTLFSASDEFVVGETLKAKAFADFDNGMKNVDVTNKVNWQSTTTTTVSVDNEGLITALSAGAAEVIAYYKGEYGSANDKVNGNVVAKTVNTIQIFSEPANATAPAGEQIKLQAYAIYNDGTNQNISDTTKWSSSNSKVTLIYSKDEKCMYATANEKASSTITATKDSLSTTQNITFTEKVADHIEIQEGYCELGDCPVITGKTVDILIVDDVNYDPVSEGAYYPTAWAVFTDGSKEYINTKRGIRWWSADQVRAYVNTIQGSFVFGRGLGDKIEISVSYKGEHKTSFFVNVKEKTITKTLKKIGILNTKKEGWGCSQNDSLYGGKLSMNIGDEGKYLMACGQFEYSTGVVKWEDINNNVAWFSSDSKVARVQTYTGELKAIGAGDAVVSAQLAEIKSTIDVNVREKTPERIEIQEGYCEDAKCPVITGKTVDIPIVDRVDYENKPEGVYYPTAWLVFDDGSKQYIGSTSGVRWWSADQVRAFVDTTRGSFVFGRGVGDGIEISVSYRGDNKTSFYVNVKEDTAEKTLKQVGIKNTKDDGWGCTQNDADYGKKLIVDKRDHGKYLQACGKFEYQNGTTQWEDINNNVAWFSTNDDVARVRTTTGELQAIDRGTATISAHLAEVKGTIDVTVE